MAGGAQQSKTTLAIVREVASKLQQPPVLRTWQWDTNLSQEETWQWIETRHAQEFGANFMIGRITRTVKAFVQSPVYQGLGRTYLLGFHTAAATCSLSNYKFISMKLNPSTDANSCSATQKIASYLWNLRVHYWTASVVQWSEFLAFLATDPEVPGWISGPTRFSEK
jgi:hypothetical protein